MKRNIVRFVVLALVVLSSACKGGSPISPTPVPTCPGSPGCPSTPGEPVRASFGTLIGVWAGDPDRIGGTSSLITPTGTTPQGDPCYVMIDPSRGGTIKLIVNNPNVAGRTLKLVIRKDWEMISPEKVVYDKLETAIVGDGSIWLGFGFPSFIPNRLIGTLTFILDETGGDLTTPTHEEKVFRFCQSS